MKICDHGIHRFHFDARENKNLGVIGIRLYFTIAISGFQGTHHGGSIARTQCMHAHYGGVAMRIEVVADLACGWERRGDRGFAAPWEPR